MIVIMITCEAGVKLYAYAAYIHIYTHTYIHIYLISASKKHTCRDRRNSYNSSELDL